MAETAVVPESTATQETERWLRAFETALADRDAAAAAELFATDCYWRDLVAFTWNLKTVEGREGVADLVEHTAGQSAPMASMSPSPRRRPTESPRPGSRSRPRSAAAAGICASRRAGRGHCSPPSTSSRDTRSPAARPGRAASSTAPSPIARVGSSAAGARPRS